MNIRVALFAFLASVIWFGSSAGQPPIHSALRKVIAETSAMNDTWLLVCLKASRDSAGVALCRDTHATYRDVLDKSLKEVK